MRLTPSFCVGGLAVSLSFSGICYICFLVCFPLSSFVISLRLPFLHPSDLVLASQVASGQDIHLDVQHQEDGGFALIPPTLNQITTHYDTELAKAEDAGAHKDAHVHT